jgi:threonine/homoserine/homoserine lactone efflux protein
MIYKGFRFGLLLQIAIGPVCLFIFQTAIASGFFTAETGVLAVVLVDAFFIFAAILGMGTLINRFSKTKAILKYFGAFVLILFGLSNILGVFNISFLPGLNLSPSVHSRNIFITMLLLTLSNPLTILFWAGVFSTKLVEENFKQNEVYLFGCGAVLSTAFFLTGVALIGSLVNTFINEEFIMILNLAVGLVLILFGVKTARKII